MIGILIEWTLFCLAIYLALDVSYRLIVRYTRFGKRIAQARTKQEITATVEVKCPIHGRFLIEESVATEFGVVCPICYKTYVTIPTYTIPDPPPDPT